VAHEPAARQLALEARLALLAVALWAHVAAAATHNVDLLGCLPLTGLAAALGIAATGKVVVVRIELKVSSRWGRRGRGRRRRGITSLRVFLLRKGD